ncbi:hypothetical protein D5S17_00170 [Pseudonocardiaceae bacterium YIM PH 21723]|nr:hypothetical protein D5S17_00170 [Pseudonocardiaceae bacterium YIM PH 21723]
MTIAAATPFIWQSARVLEQRRFLALFADGPVEPVLTCLDGYRCVDGGYGFALEPDGRGPGSQPVAALFALAIAEQLGGISRVAERLDGYFSSVTCPDGGLRFVDPAIDGYPRAPWWQFTEEPVGSLIPTANILGILHRAGVEQKWMDAATEFCWAAIDRLTSTHPYELNACVQFLDAFSSDRAVEAAARLGRICREQELVALPAGGGEVPGGTHEERFFPHLYASSPVSHAARWFSAEELAWSLDLLAAEQQPDGGWPVPWAVWTPVVEHEWRPVLTIDALCTLRAYGRAI